MSLIADAGLPVHAIDPGLDDASLQPGRVTPVQWTVALAHLKARSGVQTLNAHKHDHDFLSDSALIIGADTIVSLNDLIIGQPRDRHHARDIMSLLRDGAHEVITGVALVHPLTETTHWIVDSAVVQVGSITDNEVEKYLETDGWRGKAGAYNLAERLDAGWPIQFSGDPTTVMGLPMSKLLGHLERCWGILPLEDFRYRHE